MFKTLSLVAFLIASSSATFFNGGCGCPPPPMCLPPPPPMCMTTIQLPPIQIPTIQLPQPCCPTCACGRKKREVDVDEAPKDVACNDEKLLKIMTKEMNGDESSKVKMALIEAAESELGGRFTVVCSKGAFSFVTSTTNYCLHSQNGLNCYLFKTQ